MTTTTTLPRAAVHSDTATAVVKEYTTPAVVNLRPEENLTDIVFGNAAESPKLVSLSRKDGSSWTDVTARQFADQVTALAKGLIAAGISPGDRIGLLSKTRYEWTLADFAILTAGAVVVPIYETSAADQVAWCLRDSEAVAVVVETAAHAETVDELAGALPNLRHIWQIDAGDLDTLADDGESVPDSEVTERRAALNGDTLATIIYTSGTTGRPKGCELTHRNFLFDALTCTAAMSEIFTEGTSTLLFLPLAHVLGRVIQYVALSAKVRLGHTGDMKDLLPDLAAFQPTFVLSVPRVFEKIYNGAKTKADAGGKGRLFNLADSTAVSYSEALDRGRPNPILTLQHLLFDKLVYSKIRQSLGGEVRYAISGGAPLGARLGHFFRGAGITILEGYGLTETAAAAALNMPGAIRIGTVGRPVPGASAAIADDGEILLKGDHVFRGYWHNQTATNEVLRADGWFHTGDNGELDDEGFLRITGRKRELIVTASGKNVSPAHLEDGLRAHPLISQCVIVGDRMPYIAALITLDPEAMEGWQGRNGKTAAAGAQIRQDPDLIAAIDDAVAAVNKTVSHAEGIRKYRLLDVDFTEQGGQLTPTLKLKRNVVVRQFATEIDALYTSPRGPEPGLTNGSTAWLNARGAAHIPKTRNVPNPTTTIARPNGDDTTLLPGAEPYLADGGPVGALLIHGYTGCPQSMRPWAEHLATAGYTVSLPRLPGHGTRWQDLQQTRWPDWYGEVDNAFSALRARCDQVFVMGLSMGATLSLRLAEERPDEIAGLVLVNPSIMMKDPRLIVLPILRRFLTTLPGIASDIKKPGVTELAYDRNPLHALSSLTDLWRTVRADLGKVTAPILILRSTDDHLVKPINSQTLRNELRCPLQELLLNNSYHVATLDNDAPTIFASSVEFATAHTTPVRT